MAGRCANGNKRKKMGMHEVKIADKIIGKNHPVFIVAELSSNHLGDLNIALKTISAIKDCGADAVKIQTYTPDSITMNSSSRYFKIKQGTIWDGKTLYELYRKAYTPWDWQPKLKKMAHSLGLVFFSSPFDRGAVDFLEGLEVPAYKIASFEITDIPLIEYVASKNKPVIISTGIANKSDIKEALGACRRKGNNKIILLKCVSQYPTDFKDVNLKMIPRLEKDFGVVVGISDHTLSKSVPVASVVLGAKIIEKHIILDRKLGGPDAKFSLEPKDFKEMVRQIRETELSLGKDDYRLSEKSKRSRELRRSLFAVKDIKKGELFTEENIKSIRPGFGLHTRYYFDILGKKALYNIKKATPLKKGMVSRK